MTENFGYLINICFVDIDSKSNGGISYIEFINEVHTGVGSFLHEAVMVRKLL